MRISIITCTWNSDKFLPAALASIKSQLYSDHEVIFVDGGSQDNTLQQIEEYSGSKTVINDVRGGISKAMNAGVEAARGDLVMHLHSDDYLLHPNVLARVAATVEATGCEWLFGRILNDRAGGLFPETYIPPNYSYDALLRANIVPHAATFVRRELYARAGGFSEKLKYAMDYDMWLRLGRLAEPLQLREVLSVFRRHEGSTTEANRLASFDEDYRVRQAYLAGKPLSRLEHALRYRVRRRRLEALLGATSNPRSPG